MSEIHIHRYENPESVGWAGYIEPHDKAWILFVGLDGKTEFYPCRDQSTGAVIGDPATQSD